VRAGANLLVAFVASLATKVKAAPAALTLVVLLASRKQA